jgi:imidazoleglycerol phosphate synthase glutamine amidotransferase subunit HisH
LFWLCLKQMSDSRAEKKRPSVGVTLGATLLLQRAGENPLKGPKQLEKYD